MISQLLIHVWLPHNTEVGAGTMNPATFLRALGPEPWSVCYVEPSVRPDDSRYGDNPTRLQRHTQFQVILKPDPGNPQELYLGSLEALGIPTSQHDIRFVEDNWESPVLGAWGLGWEVWMDGLEITQFTYFQQVGGQQVEAPCVEITYGLERILMARQGAKHFKDIQYSERVTYGEMLLQNEAEMSSYNLDEADIEGQRARFELYLQEANCLLEKRLPIPAYDHLLKMSHTFNILDARGAVGVSERANIFATMRTVARKVTGLWLERRTELGHPLGIIPALAEPADAGASRSAQASTSGRADFVVEVGCEELPPADLESAVQQLREKMPALLARLRLQYGSIEVEGTPRRLAVLVSGLAARQKDMPERVRGPPAKVAFGKDGAPSKALLGFCKKNGVDAGAVAVEADAKGVEYVWVTLQQHGKTAAEVLRGELGALVAAIAFPKTMRWNGTTGFSRPVRWLLALHGSQVVPFTFGGLQAGASTRLLRSAGLPDQQVPSAAAYRSMLEAHGITLGINQRSERIWADALAAASSVDGVVPESSRGDLLAEVMGLVEAPTVLLGGFDRTFLQLPKEVLVMVMRKHQRYFPLYHKGSGDLLPHFITVANGPVHIPTVRAGNESVLQARFEDAQFFYSQDLRHPLASLRPQLAGMLFQKELGTMLDKSDRVVQLIQPLSQAMGLAGACKDAEQAAKLARADLATATVTEMTALAGTMGRHYALREGLPEAVAEAIWESVLPRTSGDQIPATPAGILVAVADRLDSLVGLVAAGLTPTASTDPYGLRRIAYGMLEALVGNQVRLDLRSAVATAAKTQRIAVSSDAQTAALEFVVRRLEQLLVDGGCGVEAVRAVLNERGHDPSLAAATARALHAEVVAGESSRLASVMTAMSRPTRIVRGKEVDPAWTVDEGRFEMEEERALHAACQSVSRRVQPDMAISDFLEVCQELIQPVDAFFTAVFVMCDDEAVRQNRLALLRDISALPAGIVDFSQLPGF
ncbi:hypothetical protein WJX72_008075 [[Myrmecia] bisecta]|uniref:glycine--tRNA ligase n=1 Tax=[Myrmecia] bisecta TaxID=41462 RepID=A0AAW1PM09_9CHLO